MRHDEDPSAAPRESKANGLTSPASSGDDPAAWASLPALDSESCDLWLELLADNELDSVQRKELLCFLERQPENWRACALAFWDRQCLERALDSEPTKTPGQDRAADRLPRGAGLVAEQWLGISASESAERLREMGVVATSGDGGPKQQRHNNARPRFGWGSAMSWAGTAGLALVTVALVTLGALLAVGARGWGAFSEAQAARVALTDQLALTQTHVQELQAELNAERTVFRSLRGVFPDQPCLIEIESTADRVVYLTDGQVSEDLVRGLLSLGHVEVRPYRPVVETSLWRSLVRPVVAIEVVKDSTQYFPGDL